MVDLDVVRQSNAGVGSLGSLVAVFVGGTSGIGESTLLALASKAVQPTIYIVGRNELAAKRIVENLHTINADGRYEFIQSDVSLLKNVDLVCEEIRRKESRINLLFLSQGHLSFKAEGIDHRLSLAYYSRVRFMHNLLPAMTGFARVVSVFRGGKERAIDGQDLGRNLSLLKFANYSATMTTMLMDKLAESHPNVSFVHTFPGLVSTNIFSGFGPILGPLLRFLTWPFSMRIAECGERNLFQSTSALYPPAKGQESGLPVPGNLKLNNSSTNGVHPIHWSGENRSNQKLLSELRRELRERIWTHTLNVFGKIEAVALLSEKQVGKDATL